jgi:hypothetical protein
MDRVDVFTMSVFVKTGAQHNFVANMMNSAILAPDVMLALYGRVLPPGIQIVVYLNQYVLVMEALQRHIQLAKTITQNIVCNASLKKGMIGIQQKKVHVYTTK